MPDDMMWRNRPEAYRERYEEALEEPKLYKHPKIDWTIRNVLASHGVSGGERLSWDIQHALHCEGITMSLHGDPIQ